MAGREEQKRRRFAVDERDRTIGRLLILLRAYRAKRAVDGGGHLFKTDGTHTPNRPWDAGKHYDADILIEELEAHWEREQPSTPQVERSERK